MVSLWIICYFNSDNYWLSKYWQKKRRISKSYIHGMKLIAFKAQSTRVTICPYAKCSNFVTSFSQSNNIHFPENSRRNRKLWKIYRKRSLDSQSGSETIWLYELVLFTMKLEIPHVESPMLNGVELKFTMGYLRNRSLDSTSGTLRQILYRSNF